MAQYTIKATVGRPYDETVEAVRGRLADVGFGVLTEIDLRATFKKKLDVDVVPQVILGACRPQLAHRAVETEPSIAALLPCNVVVRAVDDQTTAVEALDPDLLVSLTEGGSGEMLRAVATDARERLVEALDGLEGKI